MINNEISRDERVHLSEHDIIANESAAAGGAATERSPWPQTKSDTLLQDVQTQEEKPAKTLCNKIQGAIFPMIVLGIILGLVVMLFIINNSAKTSEDVVIPSYTCDTGCRMSLVESIPEALPYAPGSVSHNSTYSAWKELITSANNTIYIASMYWALRNTETHTNEPSAWQGEEIFASLQDAIKRGVVVRIVESVGFTQPIETEILKNLGAEVRRLNFTALMGNGVLHTKFIISDVRGFYVGSANMDWRSLTQVKEMGVHVAQCNCPIIDDLYKIFDIYWEVGGNSTIPDVWPEELDTYYNLTYPLFIDLGDNETAHISLSSSPPPLCTKSRDVDIAAILSVMEDARDYVYIAVMDYFPTTIYVKPKNKNIFWPEIDNMLKRIAFENKVKVKLLASYWNHTNPIMIDYLKSLKDFRQGIDVRVFVVPTYENQTQIPYARVNHNKYMVTDRIAYIGTSNWSGDYFINTAGVGMIFNQSDASMGTLTTRKQLEEVFLRDWESDYSHSIDEELPSLFNK